jgi:eukaryotic-like serine/threonine-protein kinase
VQRLAVDDAAPGTVLAQTPAGGAARAAGAPVELTVAVDGQGAGGLGVTLVPGVLGQPEETARGLLDQAGLEAEVLAGGDTDPAGVAAEPGRVWRSGPAPGAQAPTGGRVRLWVNPRAARPPPPPRRAPARARRAGGYPAAFFPRTVSSTLWACWSTTRVKSCWA